MLEQCKSAIKMLVESQRKHKPQRKTVHFSGTRTVEPWEAAHIVSTNREELRHLYIVYGELRGKSLDQIEPNRKTEPSTWWIERVKRKLAQAVEAAEKNNEVVA